MKMITKDFIRLIENINRVREYLLWSSSCDETEESLYNEICGYLKVYENSKYQKEN